MKKISDRTVIHVITATGIASVATQLVTIRELLAQFQGNEFVIALILFNWLILGGAGTLLSRIFTGHSRLATPEKLAWISFTLLCLSVFQVMAIRELRDVFFAQGASVGFYPTLVYCFCTIAPYSLVIGFVLPYSLFVIRNIIPSCPGARVYIADNIGDIAGGALFSFLLVHLTTPFQSLLLAGLPLLITACLLFPSETRCRPKPVLGAGLTLAVLLSGVLLEYRTLAPLQGKLAFYRESCYGRIEVHQDREQFTLFLEGKPVYSNNNPALAEETIHYTMAQTEQTRHILLISAHSGIMKELEKYSPDKIDYLEIDPDVTSALFRFGLLKKINGLHIINQDGRAWLMNSKNVYDAIIVSLPEPETFQLNRFFTDRFFKLAKQRLSPGGVLGFSVKGFENYLPEPQRQKISSLFNTAAESFRHIIMLPGGNIFFLCSDTLITADIPARLNEKKIQTNYISSFYYGNVTTERIASLNELVDRDQPINQDLSPSLIRLMFSQWFLKFSSSPAGFAAILVVIFLIYLLRITKEEFVLFSTGCMNMGAEILVIFAFQIFFGYIYLQIGLIITIFLAGLLPGAWLGETFIQKKRGTLVITDIMLIIVTGFFIAAVYSFGDRLPVFFYLFTGFLFSIACGCQFPVALHLSGDSDNAAVRMFSADLVGAAFGTIAASLVLIPFVGIIWTAVILLCLKIISLLVIILGYGK